MSGGPAFLPSSSSSSSSIVDTIHSLLDDRDRREKFPFEGPFEHCSQLMGKQREDQLTILELQRRIVDMRSQTKGADPMTTAQVQNLESQVKEKDDELSNLYRQQAKNTQKMLELSEKAQDHAKEMEVKDMEIRRLISLTENGEGKFQNAMRDRSVFEGENKILKTEIESLRKQMEDALAKIRQVEKENATMVNEVLKMKGQQADKLNALNEMHEKRVAMEQQRANEARNEAEWGSLPDKTVILDKKVWREIFDVRIPTKDIRATRAHKGQASAIAFDKNGHILASCGTDAAVRLYEVKSGSLLDTLSGHTASILDIDFSSDEKLIMAAGNDARALIWSMETKRQRMVLTGHTSKICACSFSTDAKQAYTGSYDRTVRIWDMQTGRKSHTIDCGSAVNYLSVCAGGNILGTAHLDRSVRLWSSRDGEEVDSSSDALK